MPLYRPHSPAPRHGVGASCVVLAAGPWAQVAQALAARFPHVALAQWQERMRAGLVQDDEGRVLAPDQPFRAGQRLYYYRALAAEAPIPFNAQILYQDAHLLVADKPHFLPVQPSGPYLQETVLVRLKRALQLEDLSPIHRIDRDTAGLVLFSTQRATRDAYQALFRQHRVRKVYEAIAPWNPALEWPQQRATRIAAGAHFMQQVEVPGEANARTTIVPLEVRANLARYRLEPITGQRHQLRVHMAALGLPIVDDGIYPWLQPEDARDYQRPLQLLAQSLEFTDPLSGVQRQFQSQRSLRPLSAWDDPVSCSAPAA